MNTLVSGRAGGALGHIILPGIGLGLIIHVIMSAYSYVVTW